MKEKFVKTIIIIIIIVFCLLIIHTVRNILILKKIDKLQSGYSDMDNHYEKIVNDNGTITEYYFKEGKSKLIINSNGSKNITTYNGDYRNIYIDNGQDKIAIVKDKNIVATQILLIKYNFSKDFKILLKVAIKSIIRTDILDEKECYVLSEFTDLKLKTYFDKETGLQLKWDSYRNGDKNDIMTVNYEYEFNTVTEEDLVEPDVSEYKVQK